MNETNHSIGKSTHVARTKGSWYGHVFRRLIHVAMLVVPLIYYAYGQQIAGFFHMSRVSMLVIILAVTFILEFIRIYFGLVFFGQRHYEARQVSAGAWGIFGVIIVLLFSPGRAYSIPLIWGLAFADPLLGELRGCIKSVFWVEVIGLVFLLLLWWAASLWLGISWWWAVFLAPITVFAEWLDYKWIDDNALMLLMPLGVILLVHYLILVLG